MTYRCFVDHGADFGVYSFIFERLNYSSFVYWGSYQYERHVYNLDKFLKRWKRVTTHETDENQHLCTIKNALIGQCAVVYE